MKISTDIAIFGGGIAGLWLLNRLKQAGYRAVLFETNALGAGQTTRSQGIIHGGMKYALQGVLTNDSQAMADMPALWRQCLEGKGEIDLSRVPLLSAHHYLWSVSKLTGKLSGLLASATLNSRVAALKKEDYPLVFQHPKFKGKVYALDEIVLDVPALVRELAKPYVSNIFKIDEMHTDDLHLDATGKLSAVIVRNGEHEMQVNAKHVVFTAGEGNELIIKKLNQPNIAMQRRPLHMVMAKVPFHYAVYAHCVGLGARPRMTVTTHYMQDGSVVWYLGGLLSETGVDKTSEQQIKAAKDELTSLFPWLDFSETKFATFKIDRAEPLQKGGLKPETSFCTTTSNITIGWPTKLALAPKLASEIMSVVKNVAASKDIISSKDVIPGKNVILGKNVIPSAARDLSNWPHPVIATPIWDEML